MKTTHTGELSTHRLLQIHVLETELAGQEAVLTRAIRNAEDHNFQGFVRLARPRLARLSRILGKLRLVLAHAEWQRRHRTCASKVQDPFLHRPANALNIEPVQPFERCLNRSPGHWPAGMAIRWRASGGGASVFGLCSFRGCPLRLGQVA